MAPDWWTCERKALTIDDVPDKVDFDSILRLIRLLCNGESQYVDYYHYVTKVLNEDEDQEEHAVILIAMNYINGKDPSVVDEILAADYDMTAHYFSLDRISEDAIHSTLGILKALKQQYNLNPPVQHRVYPSDYLDIMHSLANFIHVDDNTVRAFTDIIDIIKHGIIPMITTKTDNLAALDLVPPELLPTNIPTNTVMQVIEKHIDDCTGFIKDYHDRICSLDFDCVEEFKELYLQKMLERADDIIIKVVLEKPELLCLNCQFIGIHPMKFEDLENSLKSRIVSRVKYIMEQIKGFKLVNLETSTTDKWYLYTRFYPIIEQERVYIHISQELEGNKNIYTGSQLRNTKYLPSINIVEAWENILGLPIDIDPFPDCDEPEQLEAMQ